MTNLEWLKKNLSEEEKSNVQMCVVFNKKIYKNTCNGKDCYDCPLNKVGDLIDFLLAEHKELIKLTKFEYDLLMVFYDFTDNAKLTLDNAIIISPMLRAGYFQGVPNTSMSIQYILDNCEVIE